MPTIKVFRWIDFLTFGLLGLLVTGIVTYAELSSSDMRAQTRILLSVVGVAFWFPYAITLYFRSKGKGSP